MATAAASAAKSISDGGSSIPDDSSDEDAVIKIEDLIENEPMYHVFAEFLQTGDNKNITTVLQEICNELREIKLALLSPAAAPVASPTPPAATTSD